MCLPSLALVAWGLLLVITLPILLTQISTTNHDSSLCNPLASWLAGLWCHQVLRTMVKRGLLRTLVSNFVPLWPGYNIFHLDCICLRLKDIYYNGVDAVNLLFLFLVLGMFSKFVSLIRLISIIQYMDPWKNLFLSLQFLTPFLF